METHVKKPKPSSSGSEATGTTSSDQPQTLFEKCLASVRQRKLPYKVIVETPAFGDCFFEAAFDQIQNNEDIKATVSSHLQSCESAIELRRGFINFI